MKFLLNNDNVIYSWGYDYYPEVNQVIVKNNTTIIEIIGELNSSNCKIINIEDIIIPDWLKKYKYKLIDGKFILNTEFSESMPNINIIRNFFNSPATISALTIDLPNINNDLIFIEKAKAQLQIWLDNYNTPGAIYKIPDTLAKGIMLLDVISGETLDNEGNVIVLTAEQLQWKAEATNILYKLTTRYKIDALIGDKYDLIADLSKQINILTGLVVRLYNHIENNIPIPENIKTNYNTFANNYANAVDSGQYKDCADLRDPAELVNKLMTRNAMIAEIVKTEYLDKKVN
jgi:hypothetical protein